MPKVTIPPRTVIPKRRPSRPAQPRNYPTSPPQAVPSNARLIALDPGWTTGCALRIDGKLYGVLCYSPAEVLELVKGCQQVVIERFDTSGRLSAPARDTIDLVGQVKGLCWYLKIPLDIATPTMRYAFMTDAKKEIGKSIEHCADERHMIDALSHLLAFEYRQSRNK